MNQVDTNQLIEQNDKLKCACCGSFTGLKCKYICRSCRKKLDVRGASDIARFFLVRHLLQLVKQNAGEQQKR